jgi:hypothetical protein
MIRRQVGDEFWLITQNDHAQISGQLAKHLGNEQFAPPSSASAILGISLHDCGWPLHDDEPTLNDEHLPRHVFETPPDIGLRVWDASAERAAQRDDYAALLVSLHSLGLSVFATEPSQAISSAWNMNDPRVRFEINRFQHKMVELQESLRTRLGFRTDRPLKNGLATDSSDVKEQKLSSDFRWLGAMDRLGLAICCTDSPFDEIQRDGNDVVLDPWPFGISEIDVEVPYRRIPAKRYADNAEFQAVYFSATVERFTATIRQRRI